MGKTLVAALGTTATAAVAAPVTFLAINGSGGAGEESPNDVSPEEHNPSSIATPKPTKSPWQGKKIPALAKSSDIKGKHKESDCLKDFQGEFDWNSKAQNGNPGENYMDQDSLSKSCLVVEYYRKDVGTEGRWRGGFRLIWTVEDESQSIVTSINAYTSEEKLMFDASAYFLKKENNTWFLKWKTEDEKRNSSTHSDLSSYFPKPGAVMQAGAEDDYWGFKPDINKICKGEECSGDPESLVSNTWNWTKDTQQTTNMIDWSPNAQNLFHHLFVKWYQTPNEFVNLKGTWTKQTQQ